MRLKPSPGRIFVVGPSQTPGIGPVAWGADGSQYDAIGQTFNWDRLREETDAGFPALRMSGQQVFRWASYQMVPVAKKELASLISRPQVPRYNEISQILQVELQNALLGKKPPAKALSDAATQAKPLIA